MSARTHRPCLLRGPRRRPPGEAGAWLAPARAAAALSLAVLAAAQLAGCGQGRRPGRPEPAGRGEPVGPPVQITAGPGGGSLTSDDGGLTLVVPPDAVPAPTEFTVQRIASTAPGASSAWRVGPTGVDFSAPVSLVFRPALGRGIAGLAVDYQDATGYWVPASSNVTADAVARTLTVAATRLDASDWALVPASGARDLQGSFSLTQGVEIPFVAQGSAMLSFAGEDAVGSWYLVAGTATVPASIASGTSTCTPADVTVPLDTNVAEVDAAGTRFDWGIAARWSLTCVDGAGSTTTPWLATLFDSFGLNLPACARGYVGTPLVAPDRLQGTYAIDCGARGSVAATWDFAACPAAEGRSCPPSSACRSGASISCATGAPVCNDGPAAPDGTPCGTGRACSGGLCLPAP
jgi:hypothetical protein